jgi:hypothetical protein
MNSARNKGKLVSVHTTGGAEVYLQSLLTSTLDEDLRILLPSTYSTRAWVGPRAGLDV